MKIVVVGCGDWGKNIARTLKGLGSLYAICDQYGLEKAAKHAADLDIPMKDFEAMLHDPAVDGMIISTQPLSHYSLAKKALLAAKHVFVEKPLVPSEEEALDLESLAQEKGLVLMVGHLLRYHAVFERLVDWVKEKKLGEILHINTSRKNLGKIYPNDSVIWDLAPHDLSMILALIEKPVKSVLATSGNYAIPLHADEAMISLKFEGSSQGAFITLSRLSPFKEQKITVVGTNGMAVFDDTLGWEKKLRHFDNQITQISPTHFEILHDVQGEAEVFTPSEPLKNEMMHFIESIQHGKQPRTPAREAIEILRIIQAAHRSAKEGGWVEV
jgi:UDP-2-acetamido-3-amino-2,3-dideoxy-glucuronate N-acetyltransferase